MLAPIRPQYYLSRNVFFVSGMKFCLSIVPNSQTHAWNKMPVILQGDWGTQFGMLIQNIAETREGGLTGNGGTTVEEVSDLQKLYRESKERFDQDQEFKTRARNSVTQLQGGNPEHVQVALSRHHPRLFSGNVASLCSRCQNTNKS